LLEAIDDGLPVGGHRQQGLAPAHGC
jgi:hypothetical protein